MAFAGRGDVDRWTRLEPALTLSGCRAGERGGVFPSTGTRRPPTPSGLLRSAASLSNGDAPPRHGGAVLPRYPAASVPPPAVFSSPQRQLPEVQQLATAPAELL